MWVIENKLGLALGLVQNWVIVSSIYHYKKIVRIYYK